MNPIDLQIRRVRSVLTFHGFVARVVPLIAIAIGLIWLGLVAVRLTGRALPGEAWWWVVGPIAVAAVAAAIVAWVRRPGPTATAVAIDDALGTREKLSTALFVRDSADPFARATVRDAELAASKLDVRKKFPLRQPPGLRYAAFAIVAWLLTWSLLPQYHLFNAAAKQEAALVLNEPQRQTAAKQVEALARMIDQTPASLSGGEAMKKAREELEHLRNLARSDPAEAERKASGLSRDLSKQLKEEVEQSRQIAQAKEDERTLRNNLTPPPAQEKGEVAEAHRALAEGNPKQAAEALAKAVENFAQQSPEQQKETAAQMRKLADQLKKAGTDPAKQKDMEESLRRMGMGDQQAKEAAEAIKQAAAGNKDAEKKLQEMAQQAAKQLNNGQGATPQQQQQIDSLLKGLQAQAGSQQQADQLAQSAQKLAEAMQQAADNPASAEGQPGESKDDQPQESPDGKPSDGQGEPQPAEGQQSVSEAEERMQEALDQMEAIRQDAAAQQAMADGQGSGQPGGKNPGGGGNAPGGEGSGKGGGGKGGHEAGKGANPDAHGDPTAPPPFKSEAERLKGEQDARGKTLARTFVRDGKIQPGESRAELRRTIQAEEEQAAEEIEQQRIGRQAQKAVREYFKSLQDSSAK